VVGPRWEKKARTNIHTAEGAWRDQEKPESIFRMIDNVLRIQADAVLTCSIPDQNGS